MWQIRVVTIRNLVHQKFKCYNSGFTSYKSSNQTTHKFIFHFLQSSKFFLTFLWCAVFNVSYTSIIAYWTTAFWEQLIKYVIWLNILSWQSVSKRRCLLSNQSIDETFSHDEDLVIINLCSANIHTKRGSCIYLHLIHWIPSFTWLQHACTLHGSGFLWHHTVLCMSMSVN